MILVWVNGHLYYFYQKIGMVNYMVVELDIIVQKYKMIYVIIQILNLIHYMYLEYIHTIFKNLFKKYKKSKKKKKKKLKNSSQIYFRFFVGFG